MKEEISCASLLCRIPTTENNQFAETNHGYLILFIHNETKQIGHGIEGHLKLRLQSLYKVKDIRLEIKKNIA